jgi:hypothetical protein
MKRQILLRSLLGAPLGLAISTAMAIIVSLIIGDGKFYAVVPDLVADCGNEVNAIILQSICSLLYGSAWGGASVIWEKENWSLLRQSASHLIIVSLATFPVAYFTRWMPHSLSGILLYFGIFFAIYFVIWFTQVFFMRKRIAQLNAKIQEKIV